MEELSCTRCGHRVRISADSPTLTECPSCRALLVSAAATAVSMLTRAGEGVRIASRIELSEAFRTRWQLDRVLGAGAMGTVFLARERSGGQPVAIKFLTRPGDRGALARFVLEGRLLASVRHPNVLSVHTVDEVDGYPFLVTEYVEGGTLRERMRGGTLEVGVAVSLAIDCLGGLQACHSRGVVHRDLKPENVIVGADGRARLIDLGIAKAYGRTEDLDHAGPAPEAQLDLAETRLGSLIGTPRYMSPEQARGEPVVVASDLHAMGVVLFEMIAGRVPFTGRTLPHLLQQIIEKPAPPLASLVPSVPPGVATVVGRALAKRIEQRPASADEMATSLRNALARAPAPGVIIHEAAPSPVSVPLIRIAVALAVAGVGLMTAIGLLGEVPELVVAVFLGCGALIALATLLRWAQSTGRLGLVDSSRSEAVRRLPGETAASGKDRTRRG